MIEYLSSQPLYKWVNSSLLIGSLLLCYLLWIFGFIRQQLTGLGLPRISRFSGSSFPGIADELFVLIFMGFFATSALTGQFSAPTEDTPDNIWMSTFFHIIIFCPFALRYITLPMPQHRPLRYLLYVFAGLICIYAFNFVINASGFCNYLIELTGSPKLQEVSTELSQNKNSPALAGLCFSSIIAAPILEEFAFRGFLFNVLRQRCGIIAATLASSLLFSAVHVSLIQTLPLFVFACVQCALYEKTRSLTYCILLHMIFNTISTIAILLYSDAPL